MKFWANATKVLGHIWLGLASILILAGVIGVWMKEGFSAVQDLLSPFNIVNWFVTAITLAPGIALLSISEKLKKKSGDGLARSHGTL